MADLMGHDLKTAQSVYIKNEQSNQNSIQPSSQPTNIQSNPENSVICFEPYFMNLSRLITNLRLNGVSRNVSAVLGAVSDFNGKAKFSVSAEKSYMSKGGKIGKEGQNVEVYKLDTLYFNKLNKKITAIKIDTEGEDFKVLLGSENIIRKDKPEIIIEVREENKIDISKFLKKYSYKLFDVINLNKEIDLEKYRITNIMNLYATH